MTMTVKGFHILADLHGCQSEFLENSSSLKKILLSAAKKAEFIVVGKSFHQFEPKGATGILLLSTSHISAHTWPELGFVALDIYSCSGKEKAMKALEECIASFKPSKKIVKQVNRYR